MTTVASRPARAIAAAPIIALCAAIAMLEGYGIRALGVVAPRMMPALGLDHGQAGWALSASMIGLVAGAMIGGRLASVAFNVSSLVDAPLLGLAVDRAGVRWPMSAGYAGLVVVMMALAAGAAVLLLSFVGRRELT